MNTTERNHESPKTERHIGEGGETRCGDLMHDGCHRRPDGTDCGRSRRLCGPCSRPEADGEGCGDVLERVPVDDGEAEISQMDAHQKAIEPLWKAAFAAEPATDYATGVHVWIVDHYNTGTVVGPAQGISPSVRSRVKFVVESSDADGILSRRTYPIESLRPAAEPHVFRWPAPKGWGSVEA